MIITFDIYMDGDKKNTINVEAPRELFSSSTELVKEVRYLASAFRTHCILTGGAYHSSHFVNYINKYTRLNATYAYPKTIERIDL